MKPVLVHHSNRAAGSPSPERSARQRADGWGNPLRELSRAGGCGRVAANRLTTSRRVRTDGVPHTSVLRVATLPARFARGRETGVSSWKEIRLVADNEKRRSL